MSRLCKQKTECEINVFGIVCYSQFSETYNAYLHNLICSKAKSKNDLSRTKYCSFFVSLGPFHSKNHFLVLEYFNIIKPLILFLILIDHSVPLPASRRLSTTSKKILLIVDGFALHQLSPGAKVVSMIERVLSEDAYRFARFN